MNKELLEKLKKAGFPQRGLDGKLYQVKPEYKDSKEFAEMEPTVPTLSELIESVGFCFATLNQEHNDRTPEGYLKFSGWKATAVDATCGWVGKGLTPEEAVAELWLNIKNNVYEYHEPPMPGISINNG